MKRILFSLIMIPLILASLSGQWEILNEGKYVRTIDFVNEDIGWMAGNGTLLKTEDGGEIWNSIVVNENISITQIDFINPSLGWAIGQYHYGNGSLLLSKIQLLALGTLLRTTLLH